MKYTSKFFIAAFLMTWAYFFFVALFIIISGGIAFWYDPARDVLSAWDNLHKVTLIGPTTGIPGLFYGPYWIWLLSIPLLISKNPQFVTFIVATIPYFIVFPLVLYQFKRLFTTGVLFLLWVLFILNFGEYAAALWNPYLAPLLYLIIFYLLSTRSSAKSKQIFYIFLAGVVSGLAFNFQISLTIGTIIGQVIYLFLNSLFFETKTLSHKFIYFIKTFILFLSGIVITFIPFLLFEVRHGFSQTHTILSTVLSPYAVVGLKGISKQAILLNFFGTFGKLLHINSYLGIVLALALIITIAYLLIRNDKVFSREQKRIILLLGLVSFSVLLVYLTSKNPVWEYHFIGVEIIWLLFLGLVAQKFSLIKYLLSFCVCILIAMHFYNFISSFHHQDTTYGTVVSKEVIVKTIAQDAGNQNYAMYAYDPAIYMYDYAYLFRYLENRNFSYDPGSIDYNKPLVYLILPKNIGKKDKDVINYRTPNSKYKTAKQWMFPNGTIILKRVAR